jgi:hypothetical protein
MSGQEPAQRNILKFLANVGPARELSLTRRILQSLFPFALRESIRYQVREGYGPDPCVSGNPTDLGDIGVDFSHVLHRGLVLSHAHCGGLQLNGFVDEQISSACQSNQIAGDGRITGKDDAPVIGIEPVHKRREGCPLRNQGCGNPYVLVLHDSERARSECGLDQEAPAVSGD